MKSDWMHSLVIGVFDGIELATQDCGLGCPSGTSTDISGCERVVRALCFLHAAFPVRGSMKFNLMDS